MFRLNRALLALTLVVVLFGGVSTALAQEPAAQAAAPTAVWINPFRGTAEIQYTAPVVKRDKDMVVSSITVKNVASGPLARFTIEEFWYDGSGNPVTGDKQFSRKPLMPGETVTLVLRTPIKGNMKTNSFKFSHQNGDIKPKKVAKL
jgi:hypothetical protein